MRLKSFPLRRPCRVLDARLQTRDPFSVKQQAWVRRKRVDMDLSRAQPGDRDQQQCIQSKVGFCHRVWSDSNPESQKIRLPACFEKDEGQKQISYAINRVITVFTGVAAEHPVGEENIDRGVREFAGLGGVSRLA